jgi:hypothetical protein
MKKIIDMYFSTKSYLKNTCNHTAKYPLNQKPLCLQQKLVQERKKEKPRTHGLCFCLDMQKKPKQLSKESGNRVKIPQP